MDKNIKSKTNFKPKINVIFKAICGAGTNYVFDEDMTIHDMLVKYATDLGKPDFVNCNDKITFVWNAQNLKFGDQTHIGNFFHNSTSVIITTSFTNIQEHI